MKRRLKKTQEPGTVYFVGAGPGDPGLLTLRGCELLRRADVVIHDWLVSPGVLEHAGGAELIHMGKSPHVRQRKEGSAQEQKRINRLLVRHARQGKTVVRLKGGDPLVFARGREEARYLKQRKVPFEFVPGVSAGYGVPAYAGIPVTDRSFASMAVFVTGHEDPSKKEAAVDWKALASLKATLVSFMSIKNLRKIMISLKKGGRAGLTPVSVVEWGTLPDQRVVEGTLDSIAERAEAEKTHSPALVIIGEVNRFRKDLCWFEKKPLYGKTVLITRAESQTSRLRHSLENAGARVLEFHAIRILPPASWRPVDRAIARIHDYTWIIFTSVNGVRYFFKRLESKGKDARIFAGRRIAVIGRATAEALREKGVNPDLIPASYHSESLLKAFVRRNIRGRKILLARTDIAPAELSKGLEARGAIADEVNTYRTRVNLNESKKLRRLLKNEPIDFVTFTSSSTVHSFCRALGIQSVRDGFSAGIASIGPVTSRTLRQFHLEPSCEAQEHTIQGLVNALIHFVRVKKL